MPAKPMWLLRVPEIIEQVRSMNAPVIDRSVCERVFRVRRRRAIDLMQSIGGYQCGRTFLVNRDNLLCWLEQQLEWDGGFRSEQRRKQRLTSQLDELHRHKAAARVKIPVIPANERRRFPELPSGITLTAGTFSVSFTTAEELLARLYAFSQAVADDFESFVAVIGHDEELQSTAHF